MKSMLAGAVRTGVLAALLASVVLTLTARQEDKTEGKEARKLFKDSVTPLPEKLGLTPSGLMVRAAAAEHKTDKMDIVFTLSIPKELREKLEEKVAKGEVVSPKELTSTYSPKAADVKKLTAWLKKEGFTITHTTPNRTSVYARATVGQIEKSLQVQMVRVTKDGYTYNAARNAPSLPADVGGAVRAVIGLQPYRQMHRHSRRHVPTQGNRASRRHGGPTTNIANAPPYLVKEVLKAYNADGLPVTGAGQTIAILIDTFPVDEDLQKFWKANGLDVAVSNVEKINVKEAVLPVPEGEETLDVQWTSGVAPGAKVRVYASSSLAFVDLDLALDRIIADLETQAGLRQLSISLGLGEQFMGGPEGEVATQHQKFLLLAAAGVNVFVSSGDAGSNPDVTGHGAGTTPQAEYESSDPCVVGVGGTSLRLHPATGKVTREIGWAGSGGGKSILFDRPPWQKGPGVPEGDKRLVPDVSLAADPNRGAFIVFQGEPQQIGGTSWSAPVWAGFCALINESRIKADKPRLPFLNPLIYPLIGKECFRDITEGNNGEFTAGEGYDMVTGIGVPNVKALIKKLTATDG
jgi:kumamolisin